MHSVKNAAKLMKSHFVVKPNLTVLCRNGAKIPVRSFMKKQITEHVCLPLNELRPSISAPGHFSKLCVRSCIISERNIAILALYT